MIFKRSQVPEEKVPGLSEAGRWSLQTLRLLPLLLLLLVATERQAKAYTDPGTGALIWQMLVAGFVGALFYVRRFTSWFKTSRKRETKD
jgi:hypothetical protein